jgi:hypothetical protein
LCVEGDTGSDNIKEKTECNTFTLLSQLEKMVDSEQVGEKAHERIGIWVYWITLDFQRAL